MTRTVEEMYEAAIRKCQMVAMSEGDHTFECSVEEDLLLRQEPWRTTIGTAIDRDIAGVPRRICGLLIKVKTPEPVSHAKVMAALDKSFNEIFKT